MFEEIVGSSPALHTFLSSRKVAKVATPTPRLLILGETGTGKELVARRRSQALGARAERSIA